MNTADLVAQAENRAAAYFAIPAFLAQVSSELVPAAPGSPADQRRAAVLQLQADYLATRDTVSEGLAIVAQYQQTQQLPSWDALPKVAAAIADLVAVTNQAAALGQPVGFPPAGMPAILTPERKLILLVGILGVLAYAAFTSNQHD